MDTMWERVMGAYDKSYADNPKLFYRLIPDAPKEDLNYEILAAMQYHEDRYRRGSELKNLMWNEVLDLQVWKAHKAILDDNTEEAVKQCLDGIATILRAIDVLEGREKLEENDGK